MNENLKETLKKTKIILLDLDGTLYLNKVPFKCVNETLQALRENGKKLVYLTNNSSRTKDKYEEILKEIKLFENGDTVYTSTQATIEYIKTHKNGLKVYVVATDEVKNEFVREGINVVEDEPDLCVLAYDTTLTFEKLKKLNEFIVGGAFYISTHPDEVCPMPKAYMPDVGSFIKLIECSSKRLPDVICGKPYKFMGDSITSSFKVTNEEVMMIGDRLHTDIRFGNNNGFSSVLVLSGETDIKMLNNSNDKPKFVLDSINDMTKYME